MTVEIKNTLKFENKVDWLKVAEIYPTLKSQYIEITDMVFNADAETEKAIHVCTQNGWAKNTTYYKWIAKSQMICIKVSFPGRMRDGGAKLVPQEDDLYYYAPKWMFR